MEQFYTNKIQQIHIVGEYARKMVHDYQAALRLVDDYFSLNSTSFIQKYHTGQIQAVIWGIIQNAVGNR